MYLSQLHYENIKTEKCAVIFRNRRGGRPRRHNEPLNYENLRKIFRAIYISLVRIRTNKIIYFI